MDFSVLSFGWNVIICGSALNKIDIILVIAAANQCPRLEKRLANCT